MRTSRVMLTAALAASVMGAATAQFRPSVQQQIELGKQAKAEFVKQNKVLPSSDPRVQEIRRIGAKIVATIPESERKQRPFEYTFDIVVDDSLNAFAFPGGPVFFHTGLLDRLKTEDAVAGILAHEVTHIRNQHWASAYADNTKRKLGIMVVLQLLGSSRDLFNIADAVDSVLVGLPYSRSHENESDNIGYSMMLKGGYNPQGMIDVFKVLLDAQGGKAKDDFFSTHPDTSRRIQTLEERLKKDTNTMPAMKPRRTTTGSVSWQQGWPVISQARTFEAAVHRQPSCCWSSL